MTKSIVTSPNVKIGQYRNASGPPNYIDEITYIDKVSKTMISGNGGHYGYPNFPPDRDIGGPLNLVGFETNRNYIPIGEIYKSFGTDQYYTGGLVVNVPDATISGSYIPDSRGAEAYKKMKPTKPVFAGLNAIVELRDLPRMLRQRINDIRHIPDYWLALQFGWKPLLSDIRSCFMFQQKAQERLKQLLRDNGRPVRRKVNLQDDIDSVTTTSGTTNPFRPFWGAGWASNMKWVNVQTTGNRWWATARFRYWLPDGPKDMDWTTGMKRQLFGLYPSPTVIYNAIPWTWLIDWFTNVGDVIDNLQTGVADRLAATNFYIMRERWLKNEMFSTSTFQRVTGQFVTFTGTGTSLGSSKIRAKGDPFGFNTNEASLNGMQLSILGALGMSRLR